MLNPYLISFRYSLQLVNRVLPVVTDERQVLDIRIGGYDMGDPEFSPIFETHRGGIIQEVEAEIVQIEASFCFFLTKLIDILDSFIPLFQESFLVDHGFIIYIQASLAIPSERCELDRYNKDRILRSQFRSLFADIHFVTFLRGPGKLVVR